MRSRSKYLNLSNLKAIHAWIKKLEQRKYKPKKSLWEKAHKKLKLPYPIVGHGKKRLVYDLKNGLVLKVAISVNGNENNRTEVDLYQNVPSKLKKHLAKVKEYGHGWLIMKKIEKALPRTKQSVLVVKELQRKFKKCKIDPVDLISKNKKIRWNNMGLNKRGKFVILDYGNFIMTR
ncbi:hypothetical protein [Ammoniphilus sp. YIM 78166]|uniref:hypothetical protein n=1 Tax=Ammoniphilus sp. YIM 78166 TaxID=1644106 RepID=UPI0010700F7F|nr:hypothetical protein [Ammoniphilus sp. YIM 78166]